MNVTQNLAAARALGIDRLDAQLLLLHALGKSDRGRAWLLAHDGDPVDEQAHERFLACCSRRAAGEPLAYIVGQREFHGLSLKVDARVLDPRPDTETLVDWALELLAACSAPRVLDLGTGSGAIALAIKHARPDATVCATDASAAALALARENAARLELAVQFSQHDWLDGIEGAFDLIVSNPPYIATADPHLAALDAEPRMALVAGPDGLADIRRIALQAREHLLPSAWLLLEHGHDQARAVRELLSAAGFERVTSRRDLPGIERASGGKKPADAP
ncbi:MAG: peptide chain release factor N(5)-glutamine methyltransferase [Burkholderiales bacterium]